MFMRRDAAKGAHCPGVGELGISVAMQRVAGHAGQLQASLAVTRRKDLMSLVSV
jgi:hypothetical protein